MPQIKMMLTMSLFLMIRQNLNFRGLVSILYPEPKLYLKMTFQVKKMENFHRGGT